MKLPSLSVALSVVMSTVLVNVAAVPVIILSVDATPVRFVPSPTNDVAVTTPVATTPDELMVTAVPTIADDIVEI